MTDISSSVDVPAEDYPAVIQLPEFRPPAHLDGRSYSGGIDVYAQRTIQVAGLPPEELAQRLGAKAMRWTTRFGGHTFPRLIAKIAYTFLVADVGLGGIDRAYVVPGILGTTNDIGRWVGCDETEEITDPRYLHAVSIRIVNDEAIARVRLFVGHNAPEYIVVVGRVKPGTKTGNFRPSGPQGQVRVRTLADVHANSTRAPAPFLPPNHTLSIDLRPAGKPLA